MKKLRCYSILSTMLLMFSLLAVGQKRVPYVQVVRQATTQVSLDATSSTVKLGDPTSFTAGISPILPTVPTGEMEVIATNTTSGELVSSGPLAIGQTGSVVWSPTLPSVGDYVVQAKYAGDSNFLGATSKTAQVTVHAAGVADFTLSVPSQITVVEGQTGTMSVAITPLYGFSGNVRLSCAGAPNLSTCSLANGTVQIPVAATPSASAGTGQPVSTTISIVTTATTVTTGALLLFFGFGGLRSRRRLQTSAALALFCVVVCLAGCGGGNRYVQTNGTPLGKYQLTITGTAGNVTHTATTTLVVTAK